MTTVLNVDSDKHIRSAITTELQKKDYTVLEAGRASTALSALQKHGAQVVVLNDELPDLCGLDVLKKIKRDSELGPVRVILTSADVREHSLINAINWGADDFIIKPYTVTELIARVSLGLNRDPVELSDSRTLVAGKIEIDEIRHEASANKSVLELSPLEFNTLLFLVTHQDRMFTRQELLASVWGRRNAVSERAVDVNIRRLRKHLSLSGCDRYIQTVRANGYRFSVHD